ncbi:MAG: ATP-binding cassette domain-containing protein [Roseiarcus sp.]|jgi:molybdate transport system ATP-binding protein
MIEIAVEHAQGDFAIAADIRASGRVLALCGPSGAGKTTLLDVIAGLRRPRRSRIAVDEATFLDTTRRLDVPRAPAPHRLCLPGAAPVSAPQRRA